MKWQIYDQRGNWLGSLAARDESEALKLARDVSGWPDAWTAKLDDGGKAA